MEVIFKRLPDSKAEKIPPRIKFFFLTRECGMALGPPAACRLPLSLGSCSITRESRVQLVWEKKTKKRGTFSSLIQLKNFPNWCRIVTIRKPDYKTPRSQTTQISFLLRGTLHGAFPISVSKSAWGNPISRGANREREGERADFHGRRRRRQGS